VSASTSGNQLILSVSIGNLGTGVYSATVPVSSTGYTNNIQYPVVLVVNGGGSSTSGPLTLSSSALSYTNVSAQISQNLGVSASSATLFQVSSSESNCTNSTWLQVTAGYYYTPQQIAVTVNPSGVTAGTTCNGLITLTSGSSTQTVTVSMTTAGSSGSGNVTVSPTSLTFAYTTGQSVPAAQTVSVTNAVSGTASITFTVATSETNGTSVNWLQTNLGTNSASTPYTSLSISVAPGSLSAGTYTGTVTINPNGGTAVQIGVTMTVSSTVTVTATPTSLTWTYTVGGTAPTGTIQVSAGGATANFTAAASSTGSWLQVSPTSGMTPNTGTFNLNVSTVASALAALNPSTTPYTGTVTVQGVTQGSSQATGTTIINVSLTITAPLPVISSVINAASGVGGTSNVSVSPGEIISLFAPSNGQNPIGPASAVQLNSTTCPTPCTLVPKQMGGVQVFFLPGNFAAPLLYAGPGQINAVVPYEVSGIGSLSVEVKYLGQTSNAFPLTVVTTAPGIFTGTGGTGQAAAIQYDTQGNFSYNTPSNPAKAGWTIVLYMTGEGVVSPLPADGAVTSPLGTPDPKPLVLATVLVGTQPASVTYAEAPGDVSGVLQVNVVIPPGAGTGAVPITVTLGNNSSQSGVTVSLQ
jgi:uncharacterized protein (TIGR03437 family)